MNKFILITFIISSNFLLLGKKSPSDQPANINKNGSQTSIQNLPPIKITPLNEPSIDDLIKLSKEKSESCTPTLPAQKNTNPTTIHIKPAQWIIESSINTAPELLKGIFFYLQSRKQSINKSQQPTTIPSFHRFILVGPPGTGKTTLAHSIGYMLNYTIVFIAATSFLGNFRNQTAKNIENFF